MCGVKLALPLLLFSLALPLCGQSFDPVKVYPVPGATLNRLETDLLTAQAELQKQTQLSQTLNEQLAQSRSLLAEVQTQLQTASTLLQKSRNEILDAELWVAGGAFLTGGLVGALLVAVLR
jgi:septal ring factor EnvC (AmiA/AmiB activator)